MYQEAFERYHFGHATAAAMFLFPIADNASEYTPIMTAAMQSVALGEHPAATALGQQCIVIDGACPIDAILDIVRQHFDLS